MLVLKIQPSYLKKSKDSIIRYREPRGSRSLSYTFFIGQVLLKPTRLFTFLSFVHRRDRAQVPEEFYLCKYSSVDQLSVVLSRV